MSKKVSFDRNELNMILMALADSVDVTNEFIQEAMKEQNLKALQSQVETRQALQDLKKKIVDSIYK